MAYKHTDEASRDEHAVISGVAGKKIFNIDSDGNVINFEKIQLNDQYGFSVEATPMDELRVVYRLGLLVRYLQGQRWIRYFGR